MTHHTHTAHAPDLRRRSGSAARRRAAHAGCVNCPHSAWRHRCRAETAAAEAAETAAEAAEAEAESVEEAEDAEEEEEEAEEEAEEEGDEEDEAEEEASASAGGGSWRWQMVQMCCGNFQKVDSHMQIQIKD